MRVMMAMLFALALPFSSASADELTVKPSKHTVKEPVDRLAAHPHQKKYVDWRTNWTSN